MNNKIKTVLVVTALTILATFAAGCSAANSNTNVKIQVAEAKKQKIESSVEMSGVLLPTATANVASKISAQTTAVNVDAGSLVKEGDVLAKLDTASLDGQLMQVKAALEAAQAALLAVSNQAEIARLNLIPIQTSYDNTKSLYNAGAASKTQMDDAENKLLLYKTQYQNAAGAAVAQANANVNVARANVKNIEIQLSNTTIKSPIDGIVTNKNINIGEVAQPGVVLFTITDTSSLKLKGTVSQYALPYITVGQPIDVYSDIYPDVANAGNIKLVGPAASATGGVFPIEVSIQNNGSLRAGLSARTSIKMSADNGVVVPAIAVIQNSGESFVYIIKDNKAIKQKVQLGLSSDKDIQIIKGLNEGDKVAVNNLGSLFDGKQIVN